MKHLKKTVFAGAALFAGLSVTYAKQFSNDEGSSNALEREIGKSAKAEGKSYKKYAKKLAKTLGRVDPADQIYIFGE
ncbi:MAG: hypothetical protein ACI9R3_006133 [Verrucomicrobiales bacterium]|jgi:hypothetical protein